jgi:hypothetical protein
MVPLAAVSVKNSWISRRERASSAATSRTTH